MRYEEKFDQARFDALITTIKRSGYSVDQFSVTVTHARGYTDFPRITFQLIQIPVKELDAERDNHRARNPESAEEPR